MTDASFDVTKPDLTDPTWMDAAWVSAALPCGTQTRGYFGKRQWAGLPAKVRTDAQKIVEALPVTDPAADVKPVQDSPLPTKVATQAPEGTK